MMPAAVYVLTFEVDGQRDERDEIEEAIRSLLAALDYRLVTLARPIALNVAPPLLPKSRRQS